MFLNMSVGYLILSFMYAKSVPGQDIYATGTIKLYSRDLKDIDKVC